MNHEQHDDVCAYRFTSWGSRAAGYQVHAFLVRGVLVDTGFPAVAADVQAVLATTPIRGAIVTHAHEDHAGNVAQFARAGIPLRMSPDTERAVRRSTPIGFYRRFTWSTMLPLSGDLVPFHDPELELLRAEGHSDDHHVVWDHRTDTLFAADLYIGVRVRLAHTNEDPRAHAATLRALIARRPRRVFCAHRGLLANGVARLTAKAEWMESTIAEIEALHRAGTSLRQIRSRVLGRRGRTHWVSRGEYSPDNFVRAVLRPA